MATVLPTAKKTCTTCPQFVGPDAQVEMIGTSVKGPMCPLKLLVIGRPSLGDKATTKHADAQGKSCDSYGVPFDRTAIRDEAKHAPLEFNVAFPDITRQTLSGNQPESVITCVTCEHYVPQSKVQQDTGWNGSFCRAKGTLMLSDRLPSYAKGCSFKSNTMSPATNWNYQTVIGDYVIPFLPEYTDGFGKPNFSGLIKAVTDGTYEPTTCESDSPVSQNAKNVGIRASKKILDPKGFGPPIFLPVFDLNFVKPDGTPLFSEVEKAKIPRTGDDEHPELYMDHSGIVYKIAVLWQKLRETPAVWGPPGVGKTEVFRHLSWMMVLPFERISFTGSTELDDIAGKMMYSPDKGTYYHYGRVPTSWSKANVFTLDEPNVAPPDVWQFVRPLTDDSKQLVLDQSKTEIIRRHKFAFFGMAMNPAWDPKNVGAMELGDADGSRLMHIHMPYPTPEVERAIITNRARLDRWNEDDMTRAVDLVMKISPELRTLCDDGVIPNSWSPRNNIKVTRAMRYFAPVEAFRIAIADAFEPKAQQAVLDVVRNYAPED